MTREAAVRFLAHLGFNEIDACHIMRIMERESCGRSSTAEHDLAEVDMGVRLPSSAPGG